MPTPASAFDFRSKTALVTGGTSGIGRATALAFAAAGANVLITGRRSAEGEEVAAEVRRHGVKSGFVQGTVTDEAHVASAVAAAVELGGGALHAAFNNAGVELAGVPTTDATVDQYRSIFDVNVLGVLLSMKHELRVMKPGAAIVNNASIAGRIGMAGVGIYIASKHAVLGLTKTAALEAVANGVRVNAVSPGAIETPMVDRFTGGRQQEVIEHMKALHPIGRFGEPHEIASAVLFLCSPQAGFITGHDLVVDGGFTVP